MKKKKYIKQSNIPVFNQIDRPVSDEKTKMINDLLITIRKDQISKPKDHKFAAKLTHFNKMFRSVKDDERSNLIETFLKLDDWLTSK